MKISVCLGEIDCENIIDDINDGFTASEVFKYILEDYNLNFVEDMKDFIYDITCTNENYIDLINTIKNEIGIE